VTEREGFAACGWLIADGWPGSYGGISGDGQLPRIEGEAHLHYGYNTVIEVHAAADCPGKP
jgi:hypothetical protein